MKRIAYLARAQAEIEKWDGWTDAALQKSVAAAGVPLIIRQRGEAIRFAGRVLRLTRLIRNYKTLEKNAYLVTVPHISEYKLLPTSFFAEIIPYVYDCWPNRWNEWLAFFKRHDIRIIFFSAKQTLEHFAAQLPNVQCFWMPEGCDASSFDPARPLVDRTIDVDEFGRKHEAYHAAIKAVLAAGNYRHSHTFGRSRETLLNDLSNSKISICFPRAVTNPDFARGIETLTLRFLECMASGSLIVGKCPAELLELFGYDPVIPADMDRPGEHLVSVLQRIGDYQELADRNLKRLREVGTWDARVKSMLDVLLARGYQLA